MKFACCPGLLLVFVWSATLGAQEVRFIDLASVQQRTELRHPQADCPEGGLCGGFGGGSVGDGAPDWRDPHALGVYLLNVIPTDIIQGEPFEVEFKLLNTGRAPIDIPVSPHLSDLQPSDESIDFSYLSLALVVSADAEPQGPKSVSIGFVELYGSAKHEGTVLTLKPGEWIRVKAMVKLGGSSVDSTEPIPVQLHGGFWLRRNVFRPSPGGQFTESHNLYPNTTATPGVAARLLRTH